MESIILDVMPRDFLSMSGAGVRMYKVQVKRSQWQFHWAVRSVFYASTTFLNAWQKDLKVCIRLLKELLDMYMIDYITKNAFITRFNTVSKHCFKALYSQKH